MAALQGRLALVTGASRGIGAAVAHRLAAEGAHVIAVARTQGALEELDDAVRTSGGAATLVPLDLRDFDTIDHMGGALHERFQKLDVLVACAGVLGSLSPMGHIDPKLWREVFDVNVTANYRLIRSLDPLLQRSDSGRAVFVTCAAARDLAPFWGAYGASKAALEAMVRIYAAEVAKTALKVNLVDPGPVRTRLRAEAFPGEDRAALKAPEDVTEIFMRLAAADCPHHGKIVSA
ncbi:MAG: SDR family NAD(P)-dependent oxidoreductase [Alphaproteobacteria bacterium]|nr:SDR family NAD(P)-dependent oxidoreductase [Alphaproteobacteria bacterium]